MTSSVASESESPGIPPDTVKPRVTLWKRIAAQTDSIDWEAIGQAAAKPRGIALPVGPGPVPNLEALLAQAPRVRNALPQGASWDGVEDQYAGEPEFKKPAVTGEADAATAGR